MLQTGQVPGRLGAKGPSPDPHADARGRVAGVEPRETSVRRGPAGAQALAGTRGQGMWLGPGAARAESDRQHSLSRGKHGPPAPQELWPNHLSPLSGKETLPASLYLAVGGGGTWVGPSSTCPHWPVALQVTLPLRSAHGAPPEQSPGGRDPLACTADTIPAPSVKEVCAGADPRGPHKPRRPFQSSGSRAWQVQHMEDSGRCVLCNPVHPNCPGVGVKFRSNHV